jgi:hypothetical protein
LESNLVVLGAPIGDDAFVARYFNTTVLPDAEKLLSVLPLLPAHEAFLLLKHTASFCRMVYFIRTVPPPQSVVVGSFDIAVQRCFQSILRFALDPMSWKQVQLPISMGGFGLRAAALHAPSAFTASLSAWATSAHFSVPQFHSQFVVVPPPSQKSLSAVIDQQIDADLRGSLDARSLKRFTSAAGPRAGAWLSNIAPGRYVLLQDEFRVSAALRLGIRVMPSGSCCMCEKEADAFGSHALSCASGPSRILRHNAIRDEFFGLCREACLAPRREVMIADGSRPGDVYLPSWEGASPLMVDFAVVNPLADYNRDIDTPAVAYEAVKRARYQGILGPTPFAPLIVETFGTWGTSTPPVIARLATFLSATHDVTTAAAESLIYSRLSLVLQRMNARAVLSRIDRDL